MPEGDVRAMRQAQWTFIFRAVAHFSELLMSHLPVNVQRPNSLSVPSAAEPGLWTSQGDAEVKLRIEDSGLAAEPPLTVNQMFTRAVERFGNYTALGWKEGDQQKTLTYKEYYQACRTAAKSFLKVLPFLLMLSSSVSCD